MRIALAEGTWLDHEPGWLGADEADSLLAALREELAWEQRAIVLFGRPRPPAAPDRLGGVPRLSLFRADPPAPTVHPERGAA